MEKVMGKPTGVMVSIILLMLVLIIFIVISIYEQATIGEDSSDWDAQCLPNGHEIYVASAHAKGFAVLHLDDDGKPVKCSESK